MEGGKKLAEGGYGCVFHPEISCNGKETDNMNYVSKLQKQDFSADNEIFIGKILTDAYGKATGKPLENNFAPVISSCPVNIASIQAKDINDCTVIKKSEDPTNFILMRIRFIDMEDFDNYILKNANANLIVLTLIKGFNHLLKSIQLLINVNIVQFDLKGQNIVFDNKKTLPIIIDYGLSLPMDKIDTATMYNYFYIFAPEYYVWPLEVHYINLLLHITSEPTMAQLRDLAKRYTKSNAALEAFSPKFRNNYEILCLQTLQEYTELSFKDRIKTAIKAWTTWDNYSLSIIYLKFIFYLTRAKNNKSLDNSFVKFMTKLIVMNIHPNFKRRLSIKATINRFDEFLGSANKTDLMAIEEVITNIETNKAAINRSIMINSRKIKTLTEKTVMRKI